MEDVVTIADFYRSLNQTIYDRVIARGHFDIVKVEDLPSRGGKQANYLRQSYYKVSLVYGHSIIRYPGKAVEINGAAVVFTNPKVPYLWEKISSRQSGLVCIFNQEFLAPAADPEDFLFYQFQDCSVIPLDPAAAGKLQNSFDSMVEDLNGSYFAKYELLRFGLLALLHGLQKHLPLETSRQTSSNANERIGIAFFNALEQQFPIQHSAQVISLSSPGAFAEAMHIHVNHLNKALRAFTGEPTSVLIHKRLVLEAKNLLKGTNWSVGEIAWVLGFTEPNHFSIFFKRHTAQTPSQFRAKS